MIIAIDFDSVLMNEKDKTPISGALDAVWFLLDQGHKLYILTARKGKDIKAAQLWLRENEFPKLEVTSTKKLHTRVIIDDRAIRFDNWVNICKYFG